MDFALQRHRMVQQQLRGRGITDARRPAAQVWTIDRHAELATRAAAPGVPQALLDQLRVSGRMVIPIAAYPDGELVLIRRLPAGGGPTPTLEQALGAVAGQTRREEGYPE